MSTSGAKMFDVIETASNLLTEEPGGLGPSGSLIRI